MARRVYDKPTRCPEDGGAFVLKEHPQFGPYQECATCTVRQWLWRDGKAKGTPANVFLRKARVDAHAEFDKLWKSGFMKRAEAYAWLAKQFARHEVHMAEMDTPTCMLVVKILKAEVSRRKQAQSSAARARQ